MAPIRLLVTSSGDLLGVRVSTASVIALFMALSSDVRKSYAFPFGPKLLSLRLWAAAPTSCIDAAGKANPSRTSSGEAADTQLQANLIDSPCDDFIITQLLGFAAVRSQHLRTGMIDRHEYTASPRMYFRCRLLESQIVRAN